MEGNCGFGGSMSAEQNNAIFAGHLRKGGNFCIAKHIKLLADPKIHLAKIRRTEEDKLLSTINQFK